MKLKSNIGSNIGSRAQAKPETLENQGFPVAGEEGFEVGILVFSAKK